jgi:hypothetical protein
MPPKRKKAASNKSNKRQKTSIVASKEAQVCMICKKACSKFRAECPLHHIHAIHKSCSQTTPKLKCSTCEQSIEMVIEFDVTETFAIKSAKRGFKISQAAAQKNAIKSEIWSRVSEQAVKDGIASRNAETNEFTVLKPVEYSKLCQDVRKNVLLKWDSHPKESKNI